VSHPRTRTRWGEVWRGGEDEVAQPDEGMSAPVAMAPRGSKREREREREGACPGERERAWHAPDRDSLGDRAQKKRTTLRRQKAPGAEGGAAPQPPARRPPGRRAVLGASSPYNITPRNPRVREPSCYQEREGWGAYQRVPRTSTGTFPNKQTKPLHRALGNQRARCVPH